MDADLTNSIGTSMIGYGLLVLNLGLILVIGFGARRALERAAAVSRRMNVLPQHLIRHASVLTLGRVPSQFRRNSRRMSSSEQDEDDIELSSMGDIYPYDGEIETTPGTGASSDATRTDPDVPTGVIENPLHQQ